MVALEMIPKMARAERFVSLAPKIFGGGVVQRWIVAGQFSTTICIPKM